MSKYIYESHLGGLYTTEEAMPFEGLYCDTCGESDLALGYYADRAEAEAAIRAHDIYTDDIYTDAYIMKFLDENFQEEGADNG